MEWGWEKPPFGLKCQASEDHSSVRTIPDGHTTMITSAILQKQREQNFLYAVKNKNIDALQLAMDQQLDLLREIKLGLEESKNPFEILVSKGWIDGLKHVIGPECDFKTANKEKLLFLAIDGEKADLCRFLIDQGADLNSINEEKKSPLTRALLNSSDEICEILLCAGADVNALDPSGYSPIQSAATAGKLTLAGRLLDLGADVNNKGKDGFTALHLACSELNRDMCLLLLQANADTEIKNIHGKTPFAVVTKNLNSSSSMNLLPFQKASIPHVLLAHGADPMECDPQARNAFQALNNMTLRQVTTVARLSDQLVNLMDHLPSVDPRDTLEKLTEFARSHNSPGIVDETTFDMVSFLESRQASVTMERVMGLSSAPAAQVAPVATTPTEEIDLLDRAAIARQAAAVNLIKKTGSHP
jgi:hypothetical protein